MQPKNPFKASLGVNPPLLVGRDEAIQNFQYALDDGPGAHERISLVVGPRGIGKTVLLNRLEDVARENGWRVLSETATTGFSERLRKAIIQQLSINRREIKGLQLSLHGFGLGVDWDTTSLENSSYSLRSALKDLFAFQREQDRIAGQAPTGVLITLDEMHHQHSQEVIEFGATIQHLVREDEEIAVAMAGIPSSIKPLLASHDSSGHTNPVTFLRRAERLELGRVSDADVKAALEEPLTTTPFEWEPDALELAVKACQGYPFMIQLVGLCCVRAIENNRITYDAARKGIDQARVKLGRLVHYPALEELSAVDRTFLLKMAQDDGPSNTSDIAQRMRRKAAYIGNYRRRLIDAEIIVEAGHGKVDFALPYLRDFLREHAANLMSDY